MFTHGGQFRSALGVGGIFSLYGIAGLMVYQFGPAMGLTVSYQIVIIALILLTWPFALLVGAYRRRRADKATPDTEAKPEPGSGKLAAPAPSRAYDDITRNAEEAVQWLRGTKLADGGAQSKASADAVYALPWFMVAGPPASGKTSLLLSSGLSFQSLPSQRAAEQRLVRPTRSCEWRMTDSAVLLDTAGRYQSDGGSRDEWAALVETVKSHRGRRPLDGFVIVASLRWLMEAGEAEVEQQAKVLRSQLDDASARAVARFPVYLVWTHTDALEGFGEFFRNMKREERAQVWGATIPLAQSGNAHALFDTEFDLLFDSLMRRRLVRLGADEPPAEQLRVLDFPPRTNATRSNLGLFTSVLFRPNPFSESPLLRGFYFTANLNPNAAEAAPTNIPRAIGEGFFSEGFFKDVLLRDRDLAAAFQPPQTKYHRLRIAGIAAAGVLALGLTTAFGISYFANKRLVAQAAERGARVDAIVRQDNGADPTKKEPAAARVEVEAIEDLRDTVERLDEYDQEGAPLHMRFGLYSGDEVNNRVRNIYFEAIEQRYFKPTLAAIEGDLQAFSAGANAPATTPAPTATTDGANADAAAEEVLGKNYDLLKSYLMVSSDADKVEPTFLADQFAGYWTRSAPPELELTSRRQLDFYASQINREGAPRREPKTELISAARRRLVAYPAVNRVYKRITTDVNAQVQPVSLDSMLAGRGAGVLESAQTVPGSYTYNGYHEHIARLFETAAAEISGEDWVMGNVGASTQTSAAADASRLKSLYFRDYADHWRRFLRETRVTDFANKDEATRVLAELTASDSPMDRVVTEVVRNVDLSARPVITGIWNKIKNFFSRRSFYDTGGNTEPEREFRPLIEFAAGGDKRDATQFSQYRVALQGVLDQLEVASADQLTQTQRALLTGKDDIGLVRARQQVKRMVEGFKTAATREAADLLEQPLDNLFGMLQGGGYQQIVREYGDQVYPTAKRLESGFPFTDQGDSSVTDLGRFLNPTDGRLTQFFNTRLASSFDDVQGAYKLKENGALKFSDEFIAYLNNARRLRDAMFPNNGRTPNVDYDLTLQPAQGADILLEIDGTRIETRGTSPQSAKFTFPARSGSTSGAKITVIAPDKEPVERPFPGEWGLFKMFAAGGGQPAPGGGYALAWNVGGTTVRATLKPASQTSPFDRTLFTNLRAPQTIAK